ncbi:unnamed protein product [Camellia sinensis]
MSVGHLGSDLCRGILEFAKERPLGKSGLQWLKIHMANLYAGGVDKFSYEGRIAFTENHLDDIFDSADRPLEGRRWWLGAEDPFQCLATCINLAEALRSSSPETTISYMPVHQDGSCNGLQHYAALERDKLGAAAVNLVAGEKPADVYSGIAARVLDITWRDAKKDPATDPNASRARLLINQVYKKLVKQMVMTSVYGVTYNGARNQIKKRLKDRCAIEDDDELFAASCYAAKTTLTALGEMFEAARSIMSWLGDCAKLVWWIHCEEGRIYCYLVCLFSSLQMGFSVADLSSKLNVAKERLRGSGDDIAAADYADALKPSVIALPLHGWLAKAAKAQFSHDYNDHLALVRAYEG